MKRRSLHAPLPRRALLGFLIVLLAGGAWLQLHYRGGDVPEDVARPEVPPGLDAHPPLPPDLGRIEGRLVLAGDELVLHARVRGAMYQTAVFLERVPEDLWTAALGPHETRHTDCHLGPCVFMRPDEPPWFAFEPSIVFCGPGDTFTLWVKGLDFDDLISILPPDELRARAEATTLPRLGDPFPLGIFADVASGVHEAEEYPVETFAPSNEKRIGSVMSKYGGINLMPEEEGGGSSIVEEDGRTFHVEYSSDLGVEQWGWIDGYFVPYTTDVQAIGVQNPYHSLVDPKGSGRFVFDRVPPGLYWIRTFDPTLVTVRQPVRVRAGRVSSVTVVLDETQWMVARTNLRDEVPMQDEGCELVDPSSRGVIEGRIALADPDVVVIARERPRSMKTAVFIESVEEDAWNRPPDYPRAKPLRLELTRQTSGAEHLPAGASWAYEPSSVVAVGVRDCIQLVEPLEYQSDDRPWPWGGVLRGEIFDPSGEGGLFSESEHRELVHGAKWPGCEDGGTFLFSAWRRSDLSLHMYYAAGQKGANPPLFSALRRSVRRLPLPSTAGEKGACVLPPLRIQGFGRVEMIQRPYRLHRDGTRDEVYDPGSTSWRKLWSGDQAPLYVVGVQNPYHALVDLHDDGRFRLEGVPAGTYWLRTFDAHFATVRQEVTVRPNQSTEVEIILDRVKD